MLEYKYLIIICVTAFILLCFDIVILVCLIYNRKCCKTTRQVEAFTIVQTDQGHQILPIVHEIDETTMGGGKLESNHMDMTLPESISTELLDMNVLVESIDQYDIINAET